MNRAIVTMLGLVMVGCSARSATTSKFTVRMEGDRPTPYTLQCQVTQPDGSSSSSSYEDMAPHEYSFSGTVVSCVGQKEGGNTALLVLHLLKDGKEIQSSRTESGYGVVQAASP